MEHETYAPNKCLSVSFSIVGYKQKTFLASKWENCIVNQWKAIYEHVFPNAKHYESEEHVPGK